MHNKYDVLKLENQLCFALYAAARDVVRQYHPFLSELGITYTQYVVLMVLWEHKKISVKGLGEKLHLDSGTLTPLLKGLEKKGYVTRNRSQRDERYLVVEITPEGEKLKDAALEVPHRVAGCLNLTADEAECLYKLLYKILSD